MTPRSHEQTVGAAAVVKATGREREAWFALLDAAGGQGWEHRRIAAWLAGEHGVDPWWSQSIAVGYEQARGLRVPGQRPDGTFAASVSRTVHRPAADVVAHLTDDGLRAAWLGAHWHLRGTSGLRSVRLGTADGARATLYLDAVGTARTRVAVHHGRLADAEAVAESKAFWKAALTALAERLGD
jgi:hypothetical protein